MKLPLYEIDGNVIDLSKLVAVMNLFLNFDMCSGYSTYMLQLKFTEGKDITISLFSFNSKDRPSLKELNENSIREASHQIRNSLLEAWEKWKTIERQHEH